MSEEECERFGRKKDLATLEMARPEIVFWRGHFVFPLLAKRVGEFIEIRDKKFHPPLFEDISKNFIKMTPT